MKFHSLIAAALLPACAGGIALLALDEGAAGVPAEHVPAARDARAGYVAVYRNGDLELNIRGTAGINVLRSGLANLLQDEPPPGETGDRICARETRPVPAGRPVPASVPDAEPLSMGMLGAGFALLGWTRRRGGWADRLKRGLQFDLFPWPALCWLD